MNKKNKFWPQTSTLIVEKDSRREHFKINTHEVRFPICLLAVKLHGAEICYAYVSEEQTTYSWRR